MAVAAFDNDFSFAQESAARLGDRAGTGAKLTEEQQKQLKMSAAMQAQLRVEELLKEFTEERDKRRMLLDQAFTPEDADFKAQKTFEYDRTMDYYEVLGVEEHAPLGEVKRAYKRLSLVYHPDKTKGMTAEQQEDYQTIFISVKNANLVLSDQSTRRQYDRDRDHDRAKEQVSGVKAQKAQQVDLTDVLKRINEMQKPAGQIVDVPLEFDLEHFFYGVHRAVQRDRLVKDFYQGVSKENHIYRLHVPRGASEPLECVFREQGDYHADTRPDTVKFSVTAAPHSVVHRMGADLVCKEDVQLGPGSIDEAFISARVPGLHGRQLLLWGENPFRATQSSTSSARLRVEVVGEGLSDEGRLRFSCTFKARQTCPTFQGEKARRFLKDMVASYGVWCKQSAERRNSLWEHLHSVAAQHGVEGGSNSMQSAVRAALQALPGEWALSAQSMALLGEHSGGRAGLKAFLGRHRLGPQSGLDAEGSDSEEESLDAAALQHHRQAQSVCQAGSLVEMPAMQRRLLQRRDSEAVCDVELHPIGSPIALFTKPPCSLSFYSNAQQVTSETMKGGPSPSTPVFAVCLSSAFSSDANWQWTKLSEKLVSILESSIFKLWQSARECMPLSLTGFISPGIAENNSVTRVVPWRDLGRKSFGRSDYWLAAQQYSSWLDEGLSEESEERAIALSNRAACLAKVGHFQASLDDGRAARDLMPKWGRAWARIGLAAKELGEDHQEEALQAYRRAVELDPTAENVQGLSAVATAFAATYAEAESRSKAASAEQLSGKEAFLSKAYGLAVAHYTVALALAPVGIPIQEMEALARKEQELKSVTEGRLNVEEAFKEAQKKFLEAASSDAVAIVADLFTNRAAALCHLKRWAEAANDGRQAVRLRPSWPKARCHLAAASLGTRRTEAAYAELAWALSADSNCTAARAGLHACISTIPMWRSADALRRATRFDQDRGRPRESTRVWAISDILFETKVNEEWCHAIDDLQHQEDVLIVAGNVAGTFHTVVRALKVLKAKFRRVFFVPGNRDLALNTSEVRTARFPDSVAKFLAILAACDEIGIDTFPAAICQDVSIFPLLSWYNSEFDKTSRPDPNHGHDTSCVWPLDSMKQLWKWMLKLNEAHLRRVPRGTVLTFSHFLPLPELPYETMGKAAQAMGCEEIEDQLRQARSALHVYGHSTLRTCQVHGKVPFVNHNLGMPSEEEEAPAGPLLVFDGLRGVVAGDTSK
eukprot:TRINITY_DN31131_c0_g1_i1.p1 TRINITY_DN31131_c0_g1~~TRINITY_DN31131_c0_g1_i1.p1  ORF type:complete len:1233 (-),score=237.32 TRINITY_DN31131_c0_g1_i1:168-3830(-)